MHLSVSRVVAFVVTPLLTLVAGGVASIGAKYGLHLNSTEVTTDGVAAATTVATLGLKWLHGSAAFERLALVVEHEASEVSKVAPDAVPEAEKAVEAAAPKVVEVVEEKLGAPVVAFPPPADTTPPAAA